MGSIGELDIFPSDIFEKTLHWAFIGAGIGSVAGIAFTSLKHRKAQRDEKNEHYKETEEINMQEYDLSYLEGNRDLHIIYQDLEEKCKRNTLCNPLIRLLGGNLNVMAYLIQKNNNERISTRSDVPRYEVTQFNDSMQRTMKKIGYIIKSIKEKSQSKGTHTRLQFIRDINDLTTELWTFLSKVQKNTRADIDMRMDKYIK